MFSTYKSIRKMMALFLISLFVLTAFMGSALAVEEHEKLPDRYEEPFGSIWVTMEQISSQGGTKTYDIRVHYTGTLNVSKVKAQTITIKRSSTTGPVVFSSSFNENISPLDQPNWFSVGTLTISASYTTFYVSTTNTQMYANGAGWFSINNLTNVQL